MPFLDLNSFEAVPLVVASLALTVIALVRVHQRVDRLRGRLVWTLLVLCLPVAGPVLALLRTRRPERPPASHDSSAAG